MRLFNSLQDFYNSVEWSKCREQIRNERLNDKGETIDEFTGKIIVKKYDMIFHHKIEINMQNVNDWSISLNPQNIMIVSHQSHNEIHNRFGFNQKKVYIVTGSVCSGKTTYVNSIANKNDVILDMDNIWQCISVNERYQKPNTLKPIVFAVRETILDQIKVRNGNWSNAYVIMTESKDSELQRISKTLGAEIIYIDTDKETCIQRLKENPNGRDVNEYKGYIERYFEYLSK